MAARLNAERTMPKEVAVGGQQPEADFTVAVGVNEEPNRTPCLPFCTRLPTYEE